MKKLITILLFLPIFSFSQNEYVVKPKKNIEEVAAPKKSSFMENFPYYKMIDWKPGMRFMSEPDIDTKIIWTFGLYPKISNSKDLSLKIFIYEGLEQREVDCPRGKCSMTYLIFNCDGDKYEHRYMRDTIELRNATVFDSIDQLIYLDEVDKAKDLLLNKILYIKTSEWRTMDEGEREESSYGNQRFIQVKIINIGLGIQDGPVKIIFCPLNSTKEYCLNVRFSGINKSGYSNVFGIDFDDAFQLTNPKLEYPNISTTTWKLIQNGKVVTGMTKKECELSWGKPDDINKTTIGNTISEQWVYSSTRYLYFKNGLLTAIQN